MPAGLHGIQARPIPSLKDLLTRQRLKESQWIIEVKTGDRKGSGTDANVFIKIADGNELWTNTVKLDKFGSNDQERGHTDVYPILVADVSNTFTEPAKIELWRDKFGPLDIAGNWLVDVITVKNIINGKKYYFPAHRWIKPNQHYFFVLYDTTLPQLDLFREQRKSELDGKRITYEYTVNPATHPILPTQVKKIPEDEEFSLNYKLDIGIDNVRSMADGKLIALCSGGKDTAWKSFDDLSQMYKFNMPLPSGERRWQNDEWFGQQRVAGCNPLLIRLCTVAPPNLPVDAARVQKILGGMALDAAITQKLIFLTDHKITENLPIPDGRQICSPIALFYLTKDRKQLLPLCIQLQQKPGPDNPVFYPDGQKEAWLLAKMWYNNADSSYHQSISHLGMTHLQMEGIVVCVNRNLSPSHPVYRLLAPHFLYLIAIDWLGIQQLINPGGWVDKTMTIALTGMFELIRRGAEAWRLDTNACPPAELKSRGVDNPAVMPNYPYRDDSIAVYNAILKYVTTIVKYYYDKSEKVEQDEELQNFAAELVRPQKENGVGIRGVPLTNGKFATVDQVILSVTGIITTCSLMHAAVNFCQYEEYGYPPNYPTRMNGKIPTKTDGYTQKDLVGQLPTKAVTLDIMVITRILSAKGTNSLGDFEVQYLFDPVSVQAVRHLKHDLESISEKIKQRNGLDSNKYPYEWLDPEIIPNAISI